MCAAHRPSVSPPQVYRGESGRNLAEWEHDDDHGRALKDALHELCPHVTDAAEKQKLLETFRLGVSWGDASYGGKGSYCTGLGKVERLTEQGEVIQAGTRFTEQACHPKGSKHGPRDEPGLKTLPTPLVHRSQALKRRERRNVPNELPGYTRYENAVMLVQGNADWAISASLTHTVEECAAECNELGDGCVSFDWCRSANPVGNRRFNSKESCYLKSVSIADSEASTDPKLKFRDCRKNAVRGSGSTECGPTDPEGAAPCDYFEKVSDAFEVRQARHGCPNPRRPRTQTSRSRVLIPRSTPPGCEHRVRLRGRAGRRPRNRLGRPGQRRRLAVDTGEPGTVSARGVQSAIHAVHFAGQRLPLRKVCHRAVFDRARLCRYARNVWG